MVPRVKENPTKICVIFNYVLDYVYNSVNVLFSSWNQDIFKANNLALYCNAIHQEGAPLQIYFGFVVGTVLRISREKMNQSIVYNGH